MNNNLIGIGRITASMSLMKAEVDDSINKINELLNMSHQERNQLEESGKVYTTLLKEEIQKYAQLNLTLDYAQSLVNQLSGKPNLQQPNLEEQNDGINN